MENGKSFLYTARRIFGFSKVLLLAFPLPAAANCVDPLDANCVLEAHELVLIEHEDRLARLTKLAAGQLDFKFSTDIISSGEHGLVDFPADIPVLRVIASQDIFFDTARDEVKRQALPLLDIIAESLKNEPPDVSVFIAGHTDDRGAIEYNEELGLRRSYSVAAALARRGVYQAEIYRISFGEVLPVSDNSTSIGRAQNRRVEFLFAARTEAIVKSIEKQHFELCQSGSSINAEYCGALISLDAQKVSVAPASLPALQALESEVSSVDLSPNTTLEVLEKEKGIAELKRQNFIVNLDSQKIIVELKPLR